MNYKERSKAFCKECKLYEGCCWSTSGRYANCIEGQNFMLGWELGQQDTIEEIEKLSKSLGDSEGFHYNFYVGIMKLVEQLKK